MTATTLLFHLANALYLLAYLVRDILWLRLVTVLAGTALLTTFLLQPSPPWAAIAWNLVFLIINSVHVVLLVRARRPVPMTAVQQWLHQRLFASLRARTFVRFFTQASDERHAAGATLLPVGARDAGVLLLLEGSAVVERDGAVLVTLAPGAFIGEMGFLTGRPATADVRATSAVRAVRWPTAALRAQLARDPELRAAWQHAIGGDLVAKLRR